MKAIRLTFLFLAMIISAGSFAQALGNEDLKNQALADWRKTAPLCLRLMGVEPPTEKLFSIRA